jgi:UDP-N-acetylmuramoyl-L-alanyl-D-glutamate--2,6-diaminopimelate ligase
LLTIGVTGTNGKTTTAWLLRDLLNSVGRSSAYLGTLGLHFGSRVEELNNTTPFAIETFRLLCELTSQGCDSIAMEVSSHALVERRADGIAFDTAVFTNLTQDHLDYHGSMANYEAAKWRLFRELPEVNAKTFVPAFNVGDVTGMRWWRTFPTGSVPFAVHCSESTEFDDETLVARPKVVAIDHLEFDLWRMGSVEGTVRCRLGGSYNLENVMAAIASMIAAGFELDDVIAGCEHLRPVPGRFEVVSENHEVSVLVDYAHTPDALVKLLHAVRPLTDGRVITVFGCGGDRDRSKRPKMARAASSLSDITLVTSDNPRTEDPEAILTEVVEGIVRGRHYERVVDRSRAIERAIELAEPGDVVVVAGKGHENYQIIGRTKYPMDDREMAREALANWRGAIA